MLVISWWFNGCLSAVFWSVFWVFLCVLLGICENASFATSLITHSHSPSATTPQSLMQNFQYKRAAKWAMFGIIVFEGLPLLGIPWVFLQNLQ